MHSNLGRDRLWTPEIWGEIIKAVRTEAGQVRVAQKVFPAVLTTGASAVPQDVVNPATMTIDEGVTKAFIEVSLEFTLTHGQVDNEATLRCGRTLARFAAKSVAQTEDLLVFRGDGGLPGRVKVVNGASAGAGLLGLAQAAMSLTVDRRDPRYLELLVRRIAEGISHLYGAGQPGPYALILGAGAYGDAHRPVSGALDIAADRINALVPGGLYASAALQNAGLLVSLGGEPTVLYVGLDISPAFTHVDAEGKYRFRVVERFQFVCRDPASLVHLQLVG